MLALQISISIQFSAQLLGNRWHCASDTKNVDWLLNGISNADVQTNVRLFQYVQSFIFCPTITSANYFVFFFSFL